MLKRFVAMLWILILGVSLSACQGMPKSPGYETVSPVTTGVVAGGAIGGTVGGIAAGGIGIPVGIMLGGMVGGSIGMGLKPGIDQYTRAQQLYLRLEQAHVQIIMVGQDVMLVLPSPIFFYTDSSDFNDGMLPTLNDITDFINLYDVENVKVPII